MAHETNQNELMSQATQFIKQGGLRLEAAWEVRGTDRLAQLEMCLRELALAVGRVADAVEMCS